MKKESIIELSTKEKQPGINAQRELQTQVRSGDNKNCRHTSTVVKEKDRRHTSGVVGSRDYRPGSGVRIESKKTIKRLDSMRGCGAGVMATIKSIRPCLSYAGRASAA